VYLVDSLKQKATPTQTHPAKLYSGTGRQTNWFDCLSHSTV